MKMYSYPTKALLLAAVLAGGLLGHSAFAHPYASCLTNAAGVVSFRLNEPATNAATDSVTIIGNGDTLTNLLGPLPRGLTVTNLTGSGMTGGVFRVVVKKAGSGTPALISDNGNVFNQFERPTGVAVNKRPASPYFGRIYVSNARNLSTGTARPQGDGIYLLNADCTDAVGQGNAALDGGISFVAGGTSSPWRLRVGEHDDMLYITDFADSVGTNSCGLYRTDPNVSPGSGIGVFQLLDGPFTSGGVGMPPGHTHGSVSEVYVTGTSGGGDLTVYTTDEDYETVPGSLTELNSLWRYDIGNNPLPWSNAPNAKLATPTIEDIAQTMGLDRGANGYFYLLDNRSSGLENLLQVIDPTGPTVLYESLAASMALNSSTDLLSNAVSCAVSPDQRFLAVQRTGGTVIIVPLVNGIPNLAARSEFVGIGGSARQIAFDAANNVYLVSNATERMRVYSLGLTTTVTTGSDGTFSLVTPDTTVSMTAVSANDVFEAGATTATVTLTRTNSTLDYSQPLVVGFTTSGTAVRGTDYRLQTNSVTFTANAVTIPAGTDSVTVSLVASNDAIAELTETATLTLLAGVGYSASTPAATTLAIVDDEPATADLAVVFGSMYERLTNDYVRLRVVRRGDTNAATFTVNLGYSGAAVAGVDYTSVASVNVDPGVVNQNFDLTLPVNNLLLQGNRTITCTVASGSGYSVGTNSPSVNATIVEDEVPPETVLYSENFNTDNSANWTLRFGSGNGIDDYDYFFNHDFSTATEIPAAVPPAPHSSDTLGLFLVVNKNESSANGAAGINVYPTGQNLTGNYAVRFDMYFLVNSGPSTTEYALFGINHSGTKTNWFNSSAAIPGASVDGLFYGVEADAAALGDYVIYSAPTTASGNPTALTPGINATAFTGIFKQPPFQYAGAPANQWDTTTPSWTDVEISQIGKLVNLRINNTLIMSYTNNTAFTNGALMLGYCDAFNSVGPNDSGVVYDNLRVVSLAINITGVSIVGTNAEVTFAFGIDEPTTAFRLQTSSTVASGYADAGTATITKLSAGVYKATLATSGATRFYRMRYAIP